MQTKNVKYIIQNYYKIQHDVFSEIKKRVRSLGVKVYLYFEIYISSRKFWNQELLKAVKGEIINQSGQVPTFANVHIQICRVSQPRVFCFVLCYKLSLKYNLQIYLKSHIEALFSSLIYYTHSCSGALSPSNYRDSITPCQ